MLRRRRRGGAGAGVGWVWSHPGTQARSEGGQAWVQENPCGGCRALAVDWAKVQVSVKGLVTGGASYTLVPVSVDDLIMVFAFAPLAALLLGVTNISVPWETLVVSTVLYVVLPLAAGMATRYALERRSSHAVADFVAKLKPWSVVGLIATVVLLFGFQAGTIVDRPLVIAMIAVPLIVQTYGIFAIGMIGARMLKLPHNVAGPACLIGTSNFFELAVAVAISLFGLNSGAALATVVGVLVEVPVMLSLVALVNRTEHWYRSAPATGGDDLDKENCR